MIVILQLEGKSECKETNLIKPIKNIAKSARMVTPMGRKEMKVRNNNIPTIERRAVLVRSNFRVGILQTIEYKLDRNLKVRCDYDNGLSNGLRYLRCVSTGSTTRVGTAKPSSQKKAKAWKLLEIAAESPVSGARFVGRSSYPKFCLNILCVSSLVTVEYSGVPLGR